MLADEEGCLGILACVVTAKIGVNAGYQANWEKFKLDTERERGVQG